MNASPREGRARAATLADVGREAGVSVMAVSAALNNARSTTRVSAETRARIIAAATKLRYRPNLLARSLARRRIQTIGVAAVVEGGELNHYFLEVFNGILAAAAGREQNATVFALHDWADDAVRLGEICDGRIDGLILLAPTFSPKRLPVLPVHTPFVSIHANHLLPGVVNIESDEEQGALALVRHLLARGHRRILHLAGPAGLIGSERRIRGYQRALAEARRAFDPRWLVAGGYTTERGRAAMAAWLREHGGEPLPQAVFCANDAAALGCIEALAEAGLRVPADVSVAGFDDTLAARLSVPQLTSVRQPLREMGTCAVEQLLRRLEDSGRAAHGAAAPVVFPVEVVPRASVDAPPAEDRLGPVR